MEINAFENVIGVVTVADVVEGRFVVLTPHSESSDFGSQEDLPGAKIPSTADEATKARYIITFAVDNRPLPLVETYPSNDFALRGGWDQAANTPFSATMHLSYPGMHDGATIASGVNAIAFSQGTFTLPSGCYVYSSDIVNVGASLIVEHSGADAGKVKYSATNAIGTNFETVGYDADKNTLTVKSF